MRPNVDRTTLPLTGNPGDKPIWNSRDIDDVIAFLKTLTDADTKPTQKPSLTTRKLKTQN